MRTIFLTDIHGHYTKSQLLLKSVNYSKDDLLILGGDYFDRGPEVSLVADWLDSIYKDPNVILLRGNHELALIRFLRKDWIDSIDAYVEIEHMILNNGLDITLTSLAGTKYMKSYKVMHKKISKRHPNLLSMLESTKWYHEDDSAIYTHSTLPSNYKDKDADWESAVWDDTLKWAQESDVDKDVYVGHFALVNLGSTKPVKINNITLCDGSLAWGGDGCIIIN